jgi:prepilin-type N-terminal cleavage/methylation domain-containing protein
MQKPRPVPRAPRPGTRRRGMTLLEVLVAMVVLGVAVVGIAQGFTVGLRAAAIARATSTAMELARAKLAEVDAGLIPVTQDADGDFSDYGEPDFRFSLDSRTTDYTGLYELALTVEWPDRGETRSYTVIQWMLDRQAGAVSALQGGTASPKAGTPNSATRK